MYLFSRPFLNSGKILDGERAASRAFAGVIASLEAEDNADYVKSMKEGLKSAKGKALLLQAAHGKTRTEQLSAVRSAELRRLHFLFSK